MAQGHIVQCIGAVVDIQFPRDAMPKVYDALVLEESGDSLAETYLSAEALIDAADLVTEMRKVAHPMDAGRKGQKGIEW